MGIHMENKSMSRGTRAFAGSLFGRVVGFLTRRLRNQIVVPYLVLATIFAMAGTYLLLNSANESLHARFNNQLLDAARGAADGLTKSEIDQLAGLRAIIYTEGFGEAMSRKDRVTLLSLAAPQAANYGFDNLLVVDSTGKRLLSLSGSQDASTATAILPEGMSGLIAAALKPSGTRDKASSVVNTPDGPVFYTAGPVRVGNSVTGAVLVGTDLSRLMRQLARSSLSNGAGFYAADGAPRYMLTSSDTPPSIPALPAGWYEEVLRSAEQQVRLRTLNMPDGTYVEALGAVPGVGVGGKPIGVYGVLLSTSTLDANLRQTLWTLLPLFALGLVLIVFIGNTIASAIHKPVAQLVSASNHVAHGDLDVQIPDTRRDELGVLATRFNSMVSGLRHSLVVKDLFGRFVSPEVSEKLLAGEIELGGEQREVTILFSDLRDFTRLSEQYPAHDIVDLLNEHFSNVIEAAQQNGGIVNKFGGDSTLIVFGAPMDMPDHADRALATALEMQSALERLNEHRTREGWAPLRQGIGINTGTVVAGQIGSQARMEYTVIGDAVNLASRLQSMTKDLRGCDIVFSENTLSRLEDPSRWVIENLGPIEVRGKQKPVRAYGLHAPSTGAVGDLAWLKATQSNLGDLEPQSVPVVASAGTGRAV